VVIVGVEESRIAAVADLAAIATAAKDNSHRAAGAHKEAAGLPASAIPVNAETVSTGLAGPPYGLDTRGPWRSTVARERVVGAEREEDHVPSTFPIFAAVPSNNDHTFQRGSRYQSPDKPISGKGTVVEDELIVLAPRRPCRGTVKSNLKLSP